MNLMKHLSIVFLGIGLCLFACKKEKKNTLPEAEPESVPDSSAPSIPAIYTPKMHKNWIMDGYGYYSFHPSDTNIAHAYSDTIYRNWPVEVLVLDESAVVLRLTPGIGGDTMVHFTTDSVLEHMVFIPRLYKKIGFRPYGTSLTYYYIKDSLSYYYGNNGVSFTTELTLYSK